MNANPKLALIRDPAYLCSHRDRECLAGPGISGGYWCEHCSHLIWSVKENTDG